MKKEHNGVTAPAQYDPGWLVKLAETQIADETEIIENIKKCTVVVGFCGCGCGDPYFIDPNSKEWNYRDCEILEREDGVDIIIDIMKNKTIGRVEIGEWNKKS